MPSLERHLERLSSQHRSLDQQITGEQRRASPDPALLRRLKIEKLALKDKMRSLSAANDA